MKAFGCLLLVTLVGATTLVHAAAPSHYDVLKDKYLNDTNDSITLERLEGGYLGRCYFQHFDTPIGMVLSTRKFVTTSTKDSDQGPDFPAVTTTTTTWKMSEYQKVDSDNVPYPANENDNITSADDDSYWNSTSPREGAGVPEIKLSNGIASTVFPSTVVPKLSGVKYEVRLGNDGLIYGLAKGPAETDNTAIQSCYFYMKLF